jgi:RNA polymerase-binding transcription factor DksA
MNNSDLLRCKNIFLAMRQEFLTVSNGLGDSIASAGELRRDTVDMAASETDNPPQIRLQQTDGKLLLAIEDALTRIRHEGFGICAECGQPNSNVPLEAVPWKRWCRDCNEPQISRN